MKLKMGIVLISIILLSATALAATPTTKIPPTGVSITCSGGTVKCVYTGTGSASWNFGDKTKTVTTKNAKHTYKKAGKYTVTLTVKNAKKQTSTISKVIKIPCPKT